MIKMFSHMLELCNSTIMIYCIFHFLLYFQTERIRKYVIATIGAEILLCFMYVMKIDYMLCVLYVLCIPICLNMFLVKGKRVSKSIYAIFSLFLIGSMENILLDILDILCSITNWSIINEQKRIIIMLIVTVIWILISKYLDNVYVNRYRKLQTKFFIFISITSTLNFTIYSTVSECIYATQFGGYENKSFIEWSLLFFGIILLAEIIYIIFLYFEKTHYTIQNDFTKEYLEIEKRHFEELQAREEDTRRFRHDMKAHLTVLNTYAYEKKYDKMEEYLQQLDNSFMPTQILYQTGNEILNGILAQKIPTLEENHIKLKLDGSLANVDYVDDFDLCTIFSNALQNAIEACLQIPEELGERRISIQLQPATNRLVMRFENTVRETLIIKNNQMKTSKKDKLNHGFGLKQIEKVVRDYAGEMQLSSENNRFKIILTLKNNRG